MDLLLTNLQPGVAIFLVVLFIVVAAVAIFFLYRGVKRERHRVIAEKLKINEMDKEAFDSMLEHRFRAAGRNTHFSVLYIEIHDAKGISEAFGEKQFAAVLDTLRERLYGVLPRGTKICAYAYDMLAAFIDEDLDKKTLSDLCTFCLNEGRKPLSLVTKVRLEPDLNIGANSYNSFNAQKDTFNRNLEMALAYSRRSGLNRFTIYSSELMDKESEEYKYYQEIKSAIEGGEFTLYYQPIYSLEAGEVFAYESLLRWNHRTLGVLSPNRFLSIMEQSGDIHWVGIWAFEQLVEAEQCYKTRHQGKSVIFSLNLSLKQLTSVELVEQMRRVLKKYRANASDFCMEISESAMFDSRPEVGANIEKLRQSGFLIAIDDFGVEMSSLKKLENLKVDWVKLDRSFIEQSKDDFLIGGVVGTLVQYAARGAFKMIAEGIEDEVVLEYVKERAIPYGQGYHFGKPLPPQDYGI